jgi:hypothetical protein
MKRVWPVSSLAILALLIVQPVMATLACTPFVDASADCATCPSSMAQLGECPQLMTPVVRGQNSCCQLDVPDSTQQVLADRPTRDQGIGKVVVELLHPSVAPPTLRRLEPDRGHRTVPLTAESLRSLYCTFLI